MLRTKNAIGLFVVSLTVPEKIQERAMIGSVTRIFSKTVIDLQSWLFLEFSRERLMIRRKVRWHFLSAASRSTRKSNVSFPYLASFRREKENYSKNSVFHPFFEIFSRTVKDTTKSPMAFLVRNIEIYKMAMSGTEVVH